MGAEQSSSALRAGRWRGVTRWGDNGDVTTTARILLMALSTLPACRAESRAAGATDAAPDDADAGPSDATARPDVSACIFPPPRGVASDGAAPRPDVCPVGCVPMPGTERDLTAGCTRGILGCVPCADGCGGAPEGCHRSEDDSRVVFAASFATQHHASGWKPCDGTEYLADAALPACTP